MVHFFNPQGQEAEVFPMYGAGHAILIGLLVVFTVVLVWQREAVRRLRQNRRFMVGLSVFIIAGELLGYGLKFAYGYSPFFERLPFHLCGSMALLLPSLVLVKRYDVIAFFAGWSVACGLISYLNLGMTHYGADTWYFYHYLWKHYYLFLFPVFLFIAGDFELRYRDYGKSMIALIGYSGLIFLVNWALSTNYLYIGPNNDMAVPFLPDAWLQWPYIYPSFILVGLILFHLIYAGFGLAQVVRHARANPR